jgi:hypothetical protein
LSSVDAHHVERLQQVAIGLAGATMPSFGFCRAEGHPVEPVRPHIGLGAGNAHVAHQAFRLQPVAEQQSRFWW